MQDTNAKKCSFAVAILLIATLVLRAFMLAFSLPNIVSLGFYALAVFCAVLSTLGLKNKSDIPDVFTLKETNRVGAFSFVASVGFFVNFVVQCVDIYKMVDTRKYRNLIHFLPTCAICIFAILSCFYFICIASSLCTKSYDFRRLKVFHIAPLLWSVFYVLSIMSVAIKPLKDIDLMLKYIALIMLVLFLYFLALDVQGNASTSKLTLAFAKLFSIFGFLFFVDRMMSIIVSQAPVVDSDSVLSITIFLISLFAFSFEKEALKNSSFIKGA